METGLRLTLRYTPPQAAFVAVWCDLCFVYDYSVRNLLDRSQARSNFDRYIEDHCCATETLFTGELSAGSKLAFESRFGDERVGDLTSLLQSVFGGPDLAAEATAFYTLNPRILLGTVDIGRLHELVSSVIRAEPRSL